MPRKTRMYLPDIPVHVVHRGNNRNACFFCEDAYGYFLDRLREGLGRFGVAVHAYVLMTNHVHLLMTPLVFHGSCSTSGAIMFCTSTASTGARVHCGKDATKRVSCKRTPISSPLWHAWGERNPLVNDMMGVSEHDRQRSDPGDRYSRHPGMSCLQSSPGQ